MTGSTHTSERAFVLGLDGVPWRLIERWTNAGELPNFKRLREEGASGPLESTHPPTTPLAWPSIATGVWPDKHGIYGFQNLSADYSHEMYTSRDLRQPPLWELLSPAHVGNVPMTFPPSETGGTMVTGMMTPSTEREFTSPSTFREEVDARIPDYEISLNYPDYAGRPEAFREAVDEMLANRRELMRLQMEHADDWELFFFVYTEPDRLQHLLWDEAVLLDHYRDLDDILGEVIEYTDDHEADLYVVSDHGFGPIYELIHVNHVLEREGHLFRRKDDGARGAFASLGISRGTVRRLLNRVGLTEEVLIDALPRQLLDSVAERIPGDHALYDVDYEQTVAFVHDAGNLYINDTRRFEKGVVDPADIPTLKAELSAIFRAVTDDDGEQLLRVFDGDELFPNDPDSPDLIVNGVDGYEARNTIADTVLGDPGATAASHESTGIMLCRGPSIDAGATLRGARVVDVAPTLLHGIGEPVPANADGRVLFDAFRTDAPPSQTKVSRQNVSRLGEEEAKDDVDEDFSDVQDRLKGLGYME